MKHITLSISFSISVLLGLFMPPDIDLGSSSDTAFSSNVMVSPYADVFDSLALIELFNATNGPGWTNSWDTSMAVCTWNGITLKCSGQCHSNRSQQ